jgi:hypothetical protein
MRIDGLHVGEHGRLVEMAARELRIVGALAAAHQPRAFAQRRGDVGFDALELRAAHDRAHRRRRVGRQARAEVRDARLDALDHGVVDRRVHERAAGRAARLAAPGEVHAADDRAAATASGSASP